MNISPEIKLELERRARQTRDVHERLHLCVVLARSEGMSPESIAQAHRISVQSVYRYLSEYETELNTKHNERGGSTSKLNELQTKELHDHLQKTTYLHAREVCKYVKAKYRINYSLSRMIFWLKGQEFVYKPPMKVPGRLSPDKQDVFIEAYKTLKVSIPTKEEIYFMDAVNPQFQSKSVCGWIKRGEIKTIPTTSEQYRVHFVGALNLVEMKILTQEYETVNAESVIDFFKNLDKTTKANKIHVICDNGPSNKNKKLREYLKTSKIQIHYLPPYSPNLNPIERLWKILREKKTYNKCYEKFADFKIAIRNFFFEDIPKMKDELAQRINDNFQRIQRNTITLALV